MIAIDSSSFVAYLEGRHGPDVEATDVALAHQQAALPPAVLTELLSDPGLSAELRALVVALPRLDILDGYWERAGLLRARLLGRKRRARLADSLIAQSCLDHDVELVERDGDFTAFAELAGLKLFSTRRR
ncbi:MAG TPA: PIN domain-containing protein [Candidatus Methylomirabilis sp.]|nr:PIN domain-containing protein [Candidatus Methylomirabilis sp.]